MSSILQASPFPGLAFLFLRPRELRPYSRAPAIHCDEAVRRDGDVRHRRVVVGCLRVVRLAHVDAEAPRLHRADFRVRRMPRIPAQQHVEFARASADHIALTVLLRVGLRVFIENPATRKLEVDGVGMLEIIDPDGDVPVGAA